MASTAGTGHASLPKLEQPNKAFNVFGFANLFNETLSYSNEGQAIFAGMRLVSCELLQDRSKKSFGQPSLFTLLIHQACECGH